MVEGHVGTSRAGSNPALGTPYHDKLPRETMQRFLYPDHIVCNMIFYVKI